MRYTMRAADQASLRALEARMANCFQAGALASGCECHIDNSAPAYDELQPDPWLAAVFREEMVRCGRTPVPEDLQSVLPPLGSTDMGNVSQVMPGIHPIVGIDTGGASLHQPEFVAAAIGPSADAAVVDGAIMLARTVVRLAESADQRERVLHARATRAAS
jgi:metal-dependent amidase/aminoacylase/carboxypeptidase family protein